MNKITVSDGCCETKPTLQSIAPGTIFRLHPGDGWTRPEEWRIKTDTNSYVFLCDGYFVTTFPKNLKPSARVIPLVGPLTITPE